MKSRCSTGNFHKQRGKRLLKQMRQFMEKLSYTVNEAMSATGLGKTTLYKLIGEGRINPIKIGARTLLRASDLRALLLQTAA